MIKLKSNRQNFIHALSLGFVIGAGFGFSYSYHLLGFSLSLLGLAWSFFVIPFDH